MHMAVTCVHPFEIRSVFRFSRLGRSVSVMVFMYIIMIIGKTISFAGNPRINPTRMAPSSPSSRPKSFSIMASLFNRLMLSMVILAKSQMTIPASIDTLMALDRMVSVLSSIDLIIVFIMIGFRYGGSSSTKLDGSPFRSVFDKINDIMKVMIIPHMTIIVRRMALSIDELPTENIDKSIIIVGKRPLHGTKTFVRIAIKRSRGESMILAPLTPTALHPNPIAIVSDCLPQALHFLNVLSRVNDTLGKYPTSSNSVNIGKNIAIGGSMTDTTQYRTLYIPSTNRDIMMVGM